MCYIDHDSEVDSHTHGSDNDGCERDYNTESLPIESDDNGRDGR